MMELLVPLGLLGLIGILVLIIIYIIKPNYQTKHISSTYVWQLSLKYRKKRIPTSRIRNILIFICQLLALALIALILAMPVITEKGRGEQYDVIAVIDSSASMYAGSDGDTRFLRAVDEVSDLADDVFSHGGKMSVILADDSPEYLVQRVGADDRSSLDEALKALVDEQYACYFGSSDIEKAMQLCEEVLVENPTAETYLYTDVTYEYVPDSVKVLSVADDSEWNAAILNASAELEDNFYVLTAQIACYGNVSRELKLKVTVEGANSFDENDSGVRLEFITKPIMCDANSPKTIIFRSDVGMDATDTEDTFYYILDTERERFDSYKSIHFSFADFNTTDSFPADNEFHIYGGQKEVLRVQYASAKPNPFFQGALDVLRNELKQNYDMQVTFVREGDPYATSGFDFYIFEHQAPPTIPTDGVVFLVDPPLFYDNRTIELVVGATRDFQGVEMALTAEEGHPITNNIIADDITVTRYQRMAVGENFDVLFSCDTDPVLVAQKNDEVQIAVLAFSVHYSNIIKLPEFYILLHNIFEYYFPATVEGDAFEVGEEIQVNARGPQVTVSTFVDPIVEFPATVKFDLPSMYTLSFSSYFSQDPFVREIYIRIPQTESEINKTEYTLTGPYKEEVDSVNYNDLLIFFAAALVLLLFVEWWLQLREAK